MNKKILVAICGIGEPNFDIKLSSNIKNIDIIKQTAPKHYNSNIDFLFFAYDDSLQKNLIECDTVKIIRESGFVGEFIYRHLQPSMVSHYDRIIVMLDDIEIQQNFDLSTIIDIQDTYGFDIISPTLTIDSQISHEFMKTREELPDNSVMSTRFAEFFMYVMKPYSESYTKWLSCFDKHTKYMWGIDNILNLEHGLKLGLMNGMTIKHLFKGNLCNWRSGDDERKRLFNKIVVNHQKNKTKTVLTRGTQNNLDHALKIIECIDYHK